MLDLPRGLCCDQLLQHSVQVSAWQQVTKAEPAVPVVLPLECLSVNGRACLIPCSRTSCLTRRT